MEQSLVSQLTQIEPYRLARLTFNLSASYRTIVETIEYYERMDGYDEMDRLNAVKEWLREALGELFGGAMVRAWEKEAISPYYTPFATLSG